jgi:hypothetical protein
MARWTSALASVLLLGWGGVAEGRDDRLMFPIKEALTSSRAEGRISPDVKLFFAGEKYPAPVQRLGTFKSNRKTNGVGKSDQEACNWAFLTTVLSLQERARKEGGNAVVDIKSVYKGTVTSSATEFMCGAGSIMAGVALEGTVVKLP